MNNKFNAISFHPADILLPKEVDMTKWSVVACDQYTSQPEYWDEVRNLVADAPSTLKIILPEAELEEADPLLVRKEMERYLLLKHSFKGLPKLTSNRMKKRHLA